MKQYFKTIQNPPDDSIFEKATDAQVEIKDELESIRKRYQALQVLADDTRDRISRATEETGHPEIDVETTRWNTSVQRLLDWVETQEESLAKESAPSLDKSELKEQLDQHRVSCLLCTIYNNQ